MMEQMSALETEVAAARAMTCGAGVPPVGDDGLWERLGAAMRRARARVPDRYLPQGGDSAAASPGTYRYLCPVPGHAQKGMTGTFTVS